MKIVYRFSDDEFVIIASANEVKRLEAIDIVDSDENIISALHIIISEFDNTEVGRLLKGSRVRRPGIITLYVKTRLHSRFSLESIKKHLPKWATPPQFYFDGTLDSFKEFSGNLEILPGFGKKSAELLRKKLGIL